MAGPELPPVDPNAPHPSGKAQGLQGAAETERESHPVPAGPPASPLKLIAASQAGQKEGAMPLEHWQAQAIAGAGPGDVRRVTLHLNAMIAGAAHHPALKWVKGEMLTEQEFKDGIALVEGHRPELLHRAPPRLILVPGEDNR